MPVVLGPAELRTLLDIDLPHRLTTIDLMIWTCGVVRNGAADRGLRVEIGGVGAMASPKAAALTNPIIEAGVISCRSMIQFLGLQVQGNSLAPLTPTRQDDIWIGSIPGLGAVAPTAFLALSVDQPADRERSTVDAVTLANKLIAHLTAHSLQSNLLTEIERTGRLVHLAFDTFVYQALSNPIPDYHLTSVPTVGSLHHMYGAVMHPVTISTTSSVTGGSISAAPPTSIVTPPNRNP